MNSSGVPLSSSGPGAPADGRPPIVVVGDRSAALRVERLLPAADRADGVIRCESFLGAIAEASLRPIGAVVGPADAVEGMAEATAAALRRVAPRARVCLLASAGDTPSGETGEAACGELLDPEVGDAALAAALGLPAPAPRCDQPTIVRADPNDLSDLTLSPVPPIGPRREGPSIEADSADDHALDDALPEALIDPPCVPIAGPDDRSLGDIDLVDHILQGKAQLESLALRLICAEGRMPGAELAGPRQDVPGDRVAVEVRHGRQFFGRLHAPAALFEADGSSTAVTPAQLQVWADWLSRWLALEARFLRLRDLSMRDELTGAWNRRYFNRFLAKIIERAAEDRQQVTLMVFDIDDFKHYNDTYGHAAGDEILREVAKLMMTSVREHDVVARIGGDEFAVIFWDADQPRRPHSRHPDDVLNAAKRFQQAVVEHRFPKLLDKAAGNLTISGGLAGFPWDGRTPNELVDFADAMAGRSKKQGKNAITVGPGALVDPDIHPGGVADADGA